MLCARYAIRRFGLRTACSRKSGNDGTETDAAASNFHIAHQRHGRIVMTTAGGGPLTTDFELMSAVAAKTDSRNEEIRAMLQSFIGRMTSVSTSARLNAALDELRAQIAPLQQVWTREAAEAYRVEQTRWEQATAALNEILFNLGNAVRDGSDEVAATDRSAANAWGY